MQIPHDKFCVLPWISLETTPIGTLRPCCLADEEIRRDDGELFRLTSANLSHAINSNYMNDLRQQFLDAKQPHTCRKCWNEERAGRTSKRMHTLDRLKHAITEDTWTVEPKSLQFLDLKLGNICNLKCRICGSWSSSNFAAEELQFAPAQDRKENYHYTMLKQGAWPRENHSFWHQINGLIDGLRYIEFTGGEPFMIQEHFELLQGIVDRDLAANIEIHYNTNGTQWPDKAAELWRHFKTVEIAFSIDDIDQRFEYQRSNADWKEVNLNIQRFRELKSQLPNIQLQCCSTVNVFNVMYLEDLAHWIDQQDFDFVYWNMLQDPYYFGVASMPEKAKQTALDRLEQAVVTDKTRKEFDNISDFIKNGVSLDGHMVCLKIRDLDNKREQDLRDHHGLLAESLGYDRMA